VIRRILTGTGNTELRKKSEPVAKVTKEITKLIKDLKQTLEASDNGIGLAAPQIGVHKRIILISLLDHKDRVSKILTLINPEILSYSEDTCVMEEGCLSVPDFYADVERPCDVEVQYLDEKGHKQRIFLNGYPSREVQHEIDHLDGVLFTDLISSKDSKKLDNHVIM